jgi:hypothetical protein
MNVLKGKLLEKYGKMAQMVLLKLPPRKNKPRTKVKKIKTELNLILEKKTPSIRPSLFFIPLTKTKSLCLKF